MSKQLVDLLQNRCSKNYSQNSQKNTFARVSFLNEVAVWSGLFVLPCCLQYVRPFQLRKPWSELEIFISTVSNQMLKVNNRNTRARCEIWSNLTIKTSKRRQSCRSCVIIVNFEHILHLVLEFLLLTLSR